MGYHIRSYTRLIFFLFTITVFSQNYSEKALTGKGDLKLVGTVVKLQPEVYEAFNKMKASAAEEGITIQIISGYRSFKRQKQLWNKKYKHFIKNGFSAEETLLKIIEYSTIPGTSRHHWGTEIDIIDSNKKIPKLVLVEKNYETGVYTELKKWMDENAEKFGFYLVYTNTKTRKGFKYEPWHYSYKPLASKMLKEYLKLNFSKIVKESKIHGYSKMTSKYIQDYFINHMLDINPSLK